MQPAASTPRFHDGDSGSSAALPDTGPPQAARPNAPRSRGFKPFLILAGVMLLGCLITAGYFIATSDQESTDDAQVEADIVPLAARVSGQVQKRLVEDNQSVKKGDPIIVIDDADFAARVRQAEAQLLTAHAQADAADAQVRVIEASAKGGLKSAKALYSGSSMVVANADAQLVAARANLERSHAEARKAELDLGRTKQLVEASALPKERLDNEQVAYDAARAALAQAEAQVVAAEDTKQIAASRVDEARGRLDQSIPIDAQIATAHADADLAHARVKVDEAALELSRLQLSYTRVNAPEDGVVSKVSVQPGQMIQVGQPIAELVPARTYVVANFKETQVGRMRKGQRVVVRVDAFPGKKLEGRIESLSGGTGARFSLLPPDNASGNFVKVVPRVPVRIEWVNPPEMLLQAGISTDVTVYVR